MTNELKTEVLHSTALILRSQLKNSKPSEGLQSLRRVVNMNSGILRKMLDLRSTQKASQSPMTEEQMQHLGKFVDQKRRAMTEHKDRYGEFLQSAQRVG